MVEFCIINRGLPVVVCRQVRSARGRVLPILHRSRIGVSKRILKRNYSLCFLIKMHSTAVWLAWISCRNARPWCSGAMEGLRPVDEDRRVLKVVSVGWSHRTHSVTDLRLGFKQLYEKDVVGLGIRIHHSVHSPTIRHRFSPLFDLVGGRRLVCGCAEPLVDDVLGPIEPIGSELINRRPKR